MNNINISAETKKALAEELGCSIQHIRYKLRRRDLNILNRALQIETSKKESEINILSDVISKHKKVKRKINKVLYGKNN